MLHPLFQFSSKLFAYLFLNNIVHQYPTQFSIIKSILNTILNVGERFNVVTAKIQFFTTWRVFQFKNAFESFIKLRLNRSDKQLKLPQMDAQEARGCSLTESADIVPPLIAPSPNVYSFLRLPSYYSLQESLFAGLVQDGITELLGQSQYLFANHRSTLEVVSDRALSHTCNIQHIPVRFFPLVKSLQDSH